MVVLSTGEVDLGLTLAPLGMLSRDPTLRLGPGSMTRATLTPEGPGTLAVTWTAGHPEAEVRTSGPGADWLTARAPALLGLLDDAAGFAPTASPVRELWRRHRGDRIAATGTLWHDLAFFVVQQRVARADAAAQWARLVRALGTPAPDAPELVVPPAPAVVARLPYEAFHRFGIERQRAQHLVEAARCAHRLHADPAPDRGAVLAALAGVRGVGPWTRGCLDTFTFGAADTVITGDAGIPSMVAWLLAGERRADDARMLELLEPYRPHRYRVVRLAFAGGSTPPRRGPRTAPHEIRGR
ncbi:DNA-3-methyladenine glycosylase 2 family protein [Kineococcus sp. R8]|uniref:DNA-3-methyladenine glycosylase family protein n=1 Tax=Kineococcus siccus TaxID=2696567 RepID=UPI001412E432|nr:DNA-3-methyladenine glycosylase 2 family protein [Kineococcus siccus]NAZ81672.1 DNA-3-methyladenine glycosylase 2 family protein [Kineococcus siccus]